MNHEKHTLENRNLYLGPKGYDRARIVAYLMEKYGEVEVSGPDGESVTYTLYVDKGYVKNMIKKMQSQTE